jgi:hypothetical protein
MMRDDSFCGNAALQVFFMKPSVLAAVPAAVPAAVRVQETMATVDQADSAIEHATMVTTDAGFMHDRDIREQYPR